MMASSATEPPPARPTTQSRRRSGVLIAVFVLFQFLVPLTYLIREDSSDDRFTWRSLTSHTPDRCHASAWVRLADGSLEALELGELIHPDWVGYVEQGRHAVVDAFLRKQCEWHGAVEVEVVNHCEGTRGAREHRLRCEQASSRDSVRTAVR